MQPEDRLDALLSARLSAGGAVAAADSPVHDDEMARLLAVIDALEPLRVAQPDASFAHALEDRLLEYGGVLGERWDDDFVVLTPTIPGEDFPTIPSTDELARRGNDFPTLPGYDST